MQHRMEAVLRKYAPDAVIINYAAYRAEVTPQDGALTFAQEIRGMWTVDRYVEEFERLLDQVARQDGGHVLTKTYLTSDTGKVYTMLAHAAGRFN